MDPQFPGPPRPARGPTGCRVTAAETRPPSHGLGPASALAARLMAAAVNPGRRELRMCLDGHHHDNEQHALGSEGCEPGTSHSGVTLPTSSLCS